MQSAFLGRFGLTGIWVQEAGMALLTLALGFGLMPLLIYHAGSAFLGRYDGGSPGRLYEAVYQGLPQASAPSLIVVFGPYGLYLVCKGLRLWWRAGTRAA